MKMQGKVTKVEKIGDVVRVTADASYRDTINGHVRREATVDIAASSAAAYPIGRNVVVSIAPSGCAK